MVLFSSAPSEIRGNLLIVVYFVERKTFKHTLTTKSMSVAFYRVQGERFILKMAFSWVTR